jgi:hypothetical protein
VPHEFWQSFFLADHPMIEMIWGTADWIDCGDHFFRVLGGQYSIVGNPMEWRNYLVRKRNRLMNGT